MEIFISLKNKFLIHLHKQNFLCAIKHNISICLPFFNNEVYHSFHLKSNLSSATGHDGEERVGDRAYITLSQQRLLLKDHNFTIN